MVTLFHKLFIGGVCSFILITLIYLLILELKKNKK